MPKMKTHKGMKKVLNVRGSGSISISRAGTNHNTGKHSAKVGRVKRKGSTLSNSDFRRIKDLI